ncbi:putative beta-D-xylosidase 5 [Vitis vinifera]|uniref:Putative beta-D-xylosidase 5 n=1 Tax=Vitis vinifera TaxID=29760 RepID=A0A438F7I2_VITVI|nr:putative beta-D-xylosidase 5 [Vitis vinifera]
MAKSFTRLFFSLSILAIAFLAVSTARYTPRPNSRFLSQAFDVPGNYTYVCDASRFAALGLDMKDFVYCDSSLPYDVRVKDLVDRITLEEKARNVIDVASGVPRIGLPPYKWWSEALHGVANVGSATFFDEVVPGATSFPNVILSAASFNQSLWKTLGQGMPGLTFWSPNINVARDPRWGRILETPGEDPLTVGVYGVNYVRGLQDIEGTENTTDLNSRPLKIASSCKHFAAYDLDQWFNVDRRHFDAKVSEQDMTETFLRPFEMCVKEGDTSSVMCSFNNINGIPPCADPRFLKGVIREQWNLHGYIVSDCWAIDTIVQDQKFLDVTSEEGVALSMKAAVREGRVSEHDVDKSLSYLYVVLMRVGFFDGIPSLASLGKKDICNDEHIELAREAARQGIVLLKNDNATLPLKPVKKLALVGPHANATVAMIGNYAGIPCHYVSPLDAFSELGDVTYEVGCADVKCHNDTHVYKAAEAAKNADATIILVVMCGGPIDISFAKNNPKIAAILWAGFPGEQGGNAIADIVFGKYNPGGRSPITWYENGYVGMLPMTSMALRPIESLGYPGRTYKFFNGSTVYPFGYGLSYTNFSYSLTAPTRSVHISLTRLQQCRSMAYSSDSFQPECSAVLVDDLSCDESFEFQVAVKNVGSMDGSEVVMVYSSPPSGIVGTHISK